MKHTAVIFLALLTSACTNYTISNVDVLDTVAVRSQTQTILTKDKVAKPEAGKQIDSSSQKKKLQKFPLNIEASMTCHNTRISADTFRKNCSNRPRVSKIIKLLKERGLLPMPSESTTTPDISLTVEPINGFVERVTGFFNIITLGLSPLYHYDDYIVSYVDATKNINISKSVRISSKSSWFSLFFDNPENLTESELKQRTEENLIRMVLNDAKLSG